MCPLEVRLYEREPWHQPLLLKPQIASSVCGHTLAHFPVTGQYTFVPDNKCTVWLRCYWQTGLIQMWYFVWSGVVLEYFELLFLVTCKTHLLLRLILDFQPPSYISITHAGATQFLSQSAWTGQQKLPRFLARIFLTSIHICGVNFSCSKFHRAMDSNQENHAASDRNDGMKSSKLISMKILSHLSFNECRHRRQAYMMLTWQL